MKVSSSNSATLYVPELPPLPQTWEELLPDYIKSCMEYWIDPNNAVRREDFETKFEALRMLKPASFIPFYPIFLCHLDIMDDESLRRFIKEGQACDYYLTNACCNHYLKSIPDSARKNEIYKILKDFYPEDLHLKSRTNSKYLKPIKTNLEQSLVSWQTAQPGKELIELLNHSRQLAGFRFLQPWIALAWALKGNDNSAKLALERSFYLLDEKSASDHLQQILVSFIDFNTEQEFQCPEVENHPYRLQILAFIEMMGADLLDSKLIEKFVDASIAAFEVNHDSLVFLYFGLHSLQKFLDAHLPGNEEASAIFASFTKLQNVMLKFCVEEEITDPWILKNRSEALFYYDKEQIPSPTPNFKFDEQLALTKHSKLSLASSVAKQCSLLRTTLYTESIGQSGPSLFLPLPLLSKEKLKEFCHSALALDHGSYPFYTAVNQLRNYCSLSSEQRPYTFEKDFLSWAEFSIFTALPPQFLENPLDRKIQKDYYPDEFKKAIFDTYCYNTVLKTPNADLIPYIPLAVRDTLLASSTSCKGSLKGNPYNAYLASKHYFQWRRDESFEQWGERLKAQTYPDHDILKFFHQFWRNFHINHSKPNGENTIPKDRPKCNRGSDMPEEKFLKLQAATLLTHAEDPNITNMAKVENKAQAIKLCQMLIEVSVDRLVRRVLVIEPKEIKQTLSIYLFLLHNSFHGPKNSCYQIGLVNNNNNVVNTYIFFLK